MNQAAAAAQGRAANLMAMQVTMDAAMHAGRLGVVLSALVRFGMMSRER